MLRFDAKQGYYLYPEAGELHDVKLQVNKGTSYEKNVVPSMDLSVVKHGLRIPSDVKSYDEFVEQIKKEEDRFKTSLIF